VLHKKVFPQAFRTEIKFAAGKTVKQLVDRAKLDRALRGLPIVKNYRKQKLFDTRRNIFFQPKN
jgi:hypothetical protein